jgi:4-hydroxy-tetrahydrodipicolinate synthase
VVAGRLRRMLETFENGDVVTARTVHRGLLPVYRAMSRVGGVIFVKAALRLRGHDAGDPRLPLPPATPEQVQLIASDLGDAGVPLADAPPSDVAAARVAQADAAAAYVSSTTHTSAGQVHR